MTISWLFVNVWLWAGFLVRLTMIGQLNPVDQWVCFNKCDGSSLGSDLSSGADRLVLIIEDMTGHKPSIFFKLCWKFFIPVLSGVIETRSATERCKTSVWSAMQDIHPNLFSVFHPETGELPSVPGWLQTPPAGPVRLPWLGIRPGLVHVAVPCHLGTTVDDWAHVSDSRTL